MLPSFSPAILALADGTVFRGHSIGASGSTIGEVVFNTAITGYQEILTDPSYARQIVTLTYPHIGNVGVNAEDVESTKVHAAGLIIRDLPVLASQLPLGAIACRLSQGARRRRDRGHRYAQAHAHPARQGRAERLHPRRRPMKRRRSNSRARSRVLSGMDLAKVVSTKETYDWTQSEWRLESRLRRAEAPQHRVVAFDYGVKYNILRMLAERGCHVTVLPAQATGRRRARAEPRRHLPVERPRRSGTVRLRDCRHARIHRTRHSDLRHLPRPSDHGPRRRREDAEDEDRPSRRESSGEGSSKTAACVITSQNHGFAVDAADAAREREGHAYVALRRHAARLRAHRQARVLLPGSPGSVAGTERHRAICSTASSS